MQSLVQFLILLSALSKLGLKRLVSKLRFLQLKLLLLKLDFKRAHCEKMLEKFEHV